MSDATQYSIDWNRCIHIDEEITDDLVRRVTPQVLSLRQAGSDPITVAINSPGGNVAAADTILALITGPDQDGDTCRAITVVTNEAYSAAAVMLARGDYAVALPHARILFHDIRYSGMSDVTPAKARTAAKQLQSRNEEFSLSIADRVFQRLMWNFLDLQKYLDEYRKDFPKRTERFREVIATCGTPAPSLQFKLEDFALALYAELSRDNEGLVIRAVEHLGRWAHVMAMSQAAPHYSKDGGVGMLDGALQVYHSVAGADAEPFGHATRAADLNLLVTLAAELCASKPKFASQEYFELALSEFALIQSINNRKHFEKATQLLLTHMHAFSHLMPSQNWKRAVLKRRPSKEKQDPLFGSLGFCAY
jgi:ATP-dependent protease ClpP protease subunit